MVNNAVDHSEATGVTLAMECSHGQLQLDVIDEAQLRILLDVQQD